MPGCNVCCQVSPNVLPSTFNLSGGVTSVSAARCLLMYCQSTFNLSGGVTSAFCFGRALISSAKTFVGSCCFFWTELCVDPAPAGEQQSPGCTVCCQVLPMYCQVPSICLGSHVSFCCQMSPNVLSEHHQSAWGSYTCLLCQ